MKKLSSLIIALFVFGIGTAFGQVGANADVEVSAEVNAALTLTPTNIQFGTIQANTASYIPANTSDGTAESNTGTSASAGALLIEGTDGTDVTVSWTNATLTDGGGNSATFTPVVYLNTTEVTNGADDVTIVTGGTNLEIGGSLDAIANTGSYSTANGGGSPVTFTVQYTSI